MPNPNPALPDPGLAVWFSPDAIREHFAGDDHDASCRALSDAALSGAAKDTLFSSDRLWTLYDELCLEVLARARERETRG
jgi:hypothetical protein